MRKTISKLLACCLVVALALTVVCVGSVSASAAPGTGTVSVTSEKAKVGDTSVVAEVAFETELTEGFAGIEFYVTIPAELQGKFTSVAVESDNDANPAVINYDAVKGVASSTTAPTFTDNKAKFVAAASTVGEVSGNFTVKFTFDISDVEEAAEYPIAVSDIKAGYVDASQEVGEIVIEEGANGTVIIEEAAVEPVLDTKMTAYANNIAISSNLVITYYVNGVKNYDDFEVVISADRISADDGFNAVNKVETFKKADMMKVNDDFYAFQYMGIAMYEMNVEFTSTVHAYNDGVEVAYSNGDTKTSKQLVVALYNLPSTTVIGKTIFTDLINACTEVQKVFANDNKGSDVAKMELPDVGFPQDYASADYGTLKTAAADSNVAFAMNFMANPNIRYQFKNAAGATKIVFTYYDAVNKKDVVTEVLTSDPGVIYAGGSYYYMYADVAFYAGKADITATIYNGDTPIYSNTYCLESLLKDNLSTSVGTLAKATAKFGKSAQAYFKI